MGELLPGTEAAAEAAGGGETREMVRALCALLETHRAAAVTALDLREIHTWTDYFIIATVSSGAHRDGLLRHIKEFAREHGLSTRGAGKTVPGGWSVIDLGQAIIHLMSPELRAFYELEQLWASAVTVYSSSSP